MPSKPPIVVVTGELGCGKTTVCGRVVALARAQGMVVAGVLTLARFADGLKAGLDVEDLRTGRRRLLAERDCPSGGPQTGMWHFYADGLSWGEEALSRTAPCDLLIVDELGPLELIQGQGWTVGLDVLLAGGYRLALAVVRPALLPCFLARLGDPTARGSAGPIVTVTEANRDTLPAEIIAWLG